MNAPLLRISGLCVDFLQRGRGVRVVEDLDLEVREGEAVGLVGESGAGKSVTALSVVRLTEGTRMRVAGGAVWFEGEDLLRLAPRELRKVRGGRIGMVFQEPLSSLNPVFPAGEQIAEVLRLHRGLAPQAARAEAVRLLESVGIPDAKHRASAFPHELSGGMRQRVMIAMAVSCRPRLLIADEPTTALDVTVQAQILELFRELRWQESMGLLLISHDLSVVAQVCERVAVMYAGRLVEEGPVDLLFRAPRHPYTQGLLRCLPAGSLAEGTLLEMPGALPQPGAVPSGCPFRDRCPVAEERCATELPLLRPVGEHQRAACHLVERTAGGVW